MLSISIVDLNAAFDNVKPTSVVMETQEVGYSVRF